MAGTGSGLAPVHTLFNVHADVNTDVESGARVGDGPFNTDPYVV